MNRTALALATALLVPAAPAGAFEWTIPAGFHYLTLTREAESHDFVGLSVPALWFGGPMGPFAVHVAGGYAYQREQARGDSFNFVTARADLDVELPLGPIVPYVGSEATGWYLIDPKDYLEGFLLMTSPHVGVRLAFFGHLALDLSVFGVPPAQATQNVQNVWNLATAGTLTNYRGSTWGASGRVTIAL